MKLFEEMALGLDFGAQRGVGRGLLTISPIFLRVATILLWYGTYCRQKWLGWI